MYRLFVIFLLAIFIVILPFYPVNARQNESTEEDLSTGRLNLNFKNIDIRQIIHLLALKGNVNIVAGPEVSADVSIKLRDVTWQEALDILLAMYGYGYDRIGEAIIVEPIESLRLKRKTEKELEVVESIKTEVFTLKYLDANDMKEVIAPQLSPQGKVTVLQESFSGWTFESSDNIKKKERRKDSKLRSDKLVITDTSRYLDKIRKVFIELDIKPRQILIETRIVEVNEDFLRDIGFDWGSGSSGAESSTIGALKPGTEVVGGQFLGSQVVPSAFAPAAAQISGAFPYNTGLSLMFQKLTDVQFQVIFHALEENTSTNVLSAPHIVTLDGREATILVGTKYPILKSETSSDTARTVTASLDYYQDIGIQLNVIPKIASDASINLLIHPAVTDFNETLKARGSDGQVIAEYPIIETREAETNVFINDGETIVIGGMLKETGKEADESVPFLSRIPLLGYFFKRDTKDRKKIDLLIFITAHIVKNNQQLANIANRSSQDTEKEITDAGTD